MKAGLALFDFDGTITVRDTLIEVIKFQKGRARFFLGFFVLSPLLVLYKLGLVHNAKAKEIVLTYFFGGEPVALFQNKCDRFIESRLPSLVRKEAMDRINYHLSERHRVIVVTASPRHWVEGWCRKMNIELISTELEIQKEIVTGKLSTPNCYGIEKVKRIKSYLRVEDYEPIFAYGDTPGDKPMMALAKFQFYKKF